LVPLLNRRSGFSIKNGILLYKKLIHSVMDYACPLWSFAESTHVGMVQVLVPKCLRLAVGAPWYNGSRQIHEDLGVPFFADHIRALIASFGCRSADVWNPLVRQLGRYRELTLVVRRANQTRPESSGQSRPSQNDLTNLARYSSARHLSDILTEFFFREFPHL